MFDLGDKIGWHGLYENEWAGTIVVSEPCNADDDLPIYSADHEAEWWHLAWVDMHQPGKTFHWRGPTTKRDTRWEVEDLYLIDELP